MQISIQNLELVRKVVMSKRVVSAVVLLVLCMTCVLAGCGSKEVTLEDVNRIAKYYFDQQFEDEEYEIQEEKDAIVSQKEAYVRSAIGKDSGYKYSIAIHKEGSNVYSYIIESGKALRIGGTNVGE